MKAWAHKADWTHVALLYGMLLAVTLLFPGCEALRDANQDAANFWHNTQKQVGGGPH